MLSPACCQFTILVTILKGGGNLKARIIDDLRVLRQFLAWSEALKIMTYIGVLIKRLLIALNLHS